MNKVIRNTTRIFFVLLLIVSVFSITNVLAKDTLFDISKIKVNTKSDGVKVNDVSIKNGSINNDIEFTNKDDYITYDITLKNTSNNDITLKSISDNNDSTNLKYTYDNIENKVVEKGKEITFKMTITYDSDSTNSIISNKKLKLSISYEAPDGTTKTTDVKGAEENPNTGDNIKKLIVIGLASLLGLIITFICKKKISKTIMAIAISSILLPIGVKALSGKFVITFNNNITKLRYTVSFNTNGGSTINSIKVPSGTKLTKPSNPTKGNEKFDDWYTSSELNELYDFDKPVNGNITLYAGWGEYITSKVTYNAMNGNFEDGTKTKKLIVKRDTLAKYSHTDNVDDTGKKISDYDNDWDRTHIAGTDRGDKSKSHVVTIPGATNLIVDIYYGSESVRFDFVAVWKGNHPDYTIENNISTAKKYGGSRNSSYIFDSTVVNGIEHDVTFVEGDSVTFDFISDSSEVGSGYGYFAIVRAVKMYGDEYSIPVIDLPRTYFSHWSTTESCDINYDEENLITSDENLVLYACYITSSNVGPS